MLRNIIINITFLFSIAATAQEIKKESVFEGTLNDEIIQIYIQSFQQECTGAIYYKSIIRYKDHEYDQTLWRKFQIFANNNNGYILIDDAWQSGRYKNYIFMEQKGNSLNGFIKNETLEEKSIELKRVSTLEDFFEYRQQMEEFDDINDC